MIDQLQIATERLLDLKADIAILRLRLALKKYNRVGELSEIQGIGRFMYYLNSSLNPLFRALLELVSIRSNMSWPDPR